MAETVTVTQLCQNIEAAIKQQFPSEVWVEGMISGLRRSQNGHVYFDLVDPDATLGTSTDSVIAVALFAATKVGVNRVLKRSGNTRMADGIKIRIRGEVNYYPPQGRVQLIMSMIDPEYTLGKMELDRQKLLAELKQNGLLDKNSALPMPLLPARIALLTSNNSAAHADFMAEIEASRYNIDVTLFDCRVQGIDAVASITSALDATNRDAFDTVVLIRGGGARSDLVAFDHKEVAYAVANCRTPVICGVGHEIDRSVIDDVAHTSAKTPTAAATLLLSLVDKTSMRTIEASRKLGDVAKMRLDSAHVDITNKSLRLATATASTVERQGYTLSSLATTLQQSAQRYQTQAAQRLTFFEKQLAAFDPQQTLKRGWSITQNEAGETIRSPDDVAKDELLVTITHKGKISSRVE